MIVGRFLTSSCPGLLIGKNLELDTSIAVPNNVPVYVIDVGDIYFEAYGGHFDGMIVMNDQMVPLKKPFPYYVRKRSGIAIVKRSYLDMVLIMQRELEQFYKEFEHHRGH